MNALYLSTLVEVTTIYLDGASVAAPIRGSKYEATGKAVPSLFDDYTEDLITVTMESTTPSAITTAVGSIEKMLAVARTWWSTRQGYQVVLKAVLISGESTWQSTVADGWIEMLGAGPEGRNLGKLTIKIHLVRVNYWETSEAAVKLATAGGAAAVTPVTIANHYDADSSGHTNWVAIVATDLPAGMDLPSPARVEFMNDSNISLRNLYLAANTSGSTANQAALKTVWEAEDDTGASAESSEAGNSGGKYVQAAWNDLAESLLLYWTLAAANLDDYLGRLYKFMVRLRHGGTAYTDLWLKVKLLNTYGNQVMAETAWTLAAASEDLVELPTLRLPPYVTANQNYKSVYLALYAKRYTAGAHTLDIDFLHVLPADIFRKYVPIVYANEHDSIIDDYPNGVVYTSGASGEMVTHFPVGDPLVLLPGRAQRLYFVWDDVSDKHALIDYAATVRLWVAARRRAL